MYAIPFFFVMSYVINFFMSNTGSFLCSLSISTSTSTPRKWVNRINFHIYFIDWLSQQENERSMFRSPLDTSCNCFYMPCLFQGKNNSGSNKKFSIHWPWWKRRTLASNNQWKCVDSYEYGSKTMTYNSRSRPHIME